MHGFSSPETVSIVLCQCSMDLCKCRLFQISLRRLKFWPKCIKNAHRGNNKLIIFSWEFPPTPLTRGGIPPLVLSPTRAFGTRSDFSRTTFNYVATGLRIPIQPASVPCPSVVRPSVHHFQRSSSLKPLGQSKPNFMWSLLGKGERKFI